MALRATVDIAAHTTGTAFIASRPSPSSPRWYVESGKTPRSGRKGGFLLKLGDGLAPLWVPRGGLANGGRTGSASTTDSSGEEGLESADLLRIAQGDELPARGSGGGELACGHPQRLGQ